MYRLNMNMNKALTDNSFFEELSDAELATVVGGQSIPGLGEITVGELNKLVTDLILEDIFQPNKGIRVSATQRLWLNRLQKQ